MAISQTTSSAVNRKAERLLERGSVHPTEAFTFLVDGDHDTYLVTLTKISGNSCTCPATGKCSHIEAAELHHCRETNPQTVDQLWARVGA